MLFRSVRQHQDHLQQHVDGAIAGPRLLVLTIAAGIIFSGCAGPAVWDMASPACVSLKSKCELRRPSLSMAEHSVHGSLECDVAEELWMERQSDYRPVMIGDQFIHGRHDPIGSLADVIVHYVVVEDQVAAGP